MFKNIYIKSINNTLKVLTKHEKKKALYVLILITFNGIIEVLGLALILPVLYIISDPNIIISFPENFNALKKEIEKKFSIHKKT